MLKCFQSFGRFVCLIDGESYIVKEIIIDGKKIDRNIELTNMRNYKIDGDTIIIETDTENKDRDMKEDTEFLREYYRKEIPTLSEIKKAKEILRYYKDPEKKLKLYLGIIGGKPANSVCLYDIVNYKDLIKHGFTAKEDSNGNIWAFEKRKNGRTVRILVENYFDGTYIIKFIRIYDKLEISPICLCLTNLKGVNVRGELT